MRVERGGKALGVLLKPVIYTMSRRRQAQLDGRIYLRGLHQPASVSRDRWGVPTINAGNRRDLFFVQGFVHAQDRLWQMELNRRAAKGELSALFGRATLNIDRLSRTLGFDRLGRQHWGSLGEKIRGDIEAYAAGVNAFLESRAQLPVEFSMLGHTPAPWRPSDSLAYARLQMWALTHGAGGELVQARLIEKLGPERAALFGIAYPADHPATLPRGIEVGEVSGGDRVEPTLPQFLGKGTIDGAGRGSNAWVIAGSRSATGRPILCNDMHLPVGTPSLWYYWQLRSEDGFSCAGYSQPGLPFVLVGHNDHIAWGATLSYCDCEDLFIEKTEEDSGRYRFRGEWRQMAMIEERIQVRGGREHIETVAWTHHGPLIGEFLGANGQSVALSSTALQVEAGFEGFAMLNEAANWEEFVAAVSRIKAPSLNLLYADVANNIGYHLSGTVPVRANGDGTVPAPGWTGEYEWVGEVPFGEMPHAYNPARGLIVSANHQIVSESYPHFLGRVWRNGYRARRIEELIGSNDQVSLNDCQRFQLDSHSLPGVELAALLRETALVDADAAVSHRLLCEWDGRLDVDSVGGAVYEVLLVRFARAILSPLLDPVTQYELLGLGPNPLLAPVNEFQGYWPMTLIRLLKGSEHAWLPDKASVIERCLNETTRELRRLLGEDPQAWRWGRLHRIRFSHPFGMIGPLEAVFSQGPFPIGGDGDTVAQTAIRPDLPYENNAISISSRHIVDLGDLDNSRAMYAPGQSGQLASAYYGNMIQPWLTGDYFRMKWQEESVEAACRHRLRLAPLLNSKGANPGGTAET